MEKIVYYYWIGPLTKTIEKNLELLEKIGYKAQKQTIQDHEYLTKNVELYNYYFKNNNNNCYSAFLSDIWRFYKLSNNFGTYIDINKPLNSSFETFLNTNQDSKCVFIRERYDLIASFAFSINCKQGQEVMKLCHLTHKLWTLDNKWNPIINMHHGYFKMYAKTNFEQSIPWINFISPELITKWIYLKFDVKNSYKDLNTNQIQILTLDKFVNKYHSNPPIQAIGSASWLPDENESFGKNYFEFSAKAFISSKENKIDKKNYLKSLLRRENLIRVMLSKRKMKQLEKIVLNKENNDTLL